MQVQQNRQDALTNVDEPKTSLKKINIYMQGSHQQANLLPYAEHWQNFILLSF